MTISPDSQGWYSFERDIDPEVAEQLKRVGKISKLSLKKIPLVTVKQARRLSGLHIDSLWLWCDVTRRAMRQIIQTPGLRELDVLCIKGPGVLGNFRKAESLEIFRANHYMTEADLLEVTECAQLMQLGAQGAELSSTSLAAILGLPNLTSLDLESTRFNDNMAKKVSRSKTIESLDIGATRITGVGLEHLSQMSQLRSIDLWATEVKEVDLQFLLDMPKLEYASFGNHEDLPQLDAEKVCGLILESPSLKRVWLDGIRLNAAQQEALEAKLVSLRIT
ncbi:hypothetical protein [Undibacterium sp. Di24W]|uniref:hypothetical protein n=1 Tax=Undibacterium sp. Di24W TaxID=3413033 RepID=UPI003BF211B6